MSIQTSTMNPTWKGLTMSQITAGIRMNQNSGKNSSFRAQPLKIYRKEIASTPLDNPTIQRSCMMMSDINIPGGYIITTSTLNPNGRVITLDAAEANITNNSTYNGSPCTALSTQGVCLTVENNARRRVRSAGMSRPKFSGQGLGNSYNFDTKQYLESRNKTFSQNQFNYFRSGYSSGKPGMPVANSNIYSSAAASICPKYYIASNVSFSYQWTDGGVIFEQNHSDSSITTNAPIPTIVNIPPGSYSVEDINIILKQTMTNNGHYYINNNDNSRVFLLDIQYNVATQKVDLKTFFTNNIIFPSNFTPYLNTNKIPTINTYAPYFIIPTSMSQAFGIIANKYPISTPSGNVFVATNRSTEFNSFGTRTTVSSSSFSPRLQSYQYTRSYYKPNNSQFAQQGAVSASSLITRVKYNTITSNSLKYQSVLGSAVASAMAYNGDTSISYTLKNKMGFPQPKTPVFTDRGDMCLKSNVRVRR